MTLGYKIQKQHQLNQDFFGVNIVYEIVYCTVSAIDSSQTSVELSNKSLSGSSFYITSQTNKLLTMTSSTNTSTLQ